MVGKSGVYIPCWVVHGPCHMTLVVHFCQQTTFANVKSRLCFLPPPPYNDNNDGPDDAFALSGPLGEFFF